MSRRTTSAPRPARLHARRPHHRARPAAEGLEVRLALAALGLVPTFGAGGADLGAFDAGAGTTLSNASAVAVQADGKVVVAGTIAHRYFGLTGSTSILAIRRYNADGSVDTTFGTAGETDIPLAGVNPGTTIGIGTAPADVVIQPNGRIVFAAGIESTAADLSTSDRTIVACVGTDGRLDGSFGSGGTTILETLDARLNSVAVQPDGSIVAAGTLATGAINGAQIAAARLTPGGVLDPTFGSGGVATYGAGSGDGVITTAGGQILLAADLNPTTTATLNSLGVIYRLAADGAIDPTYGTNGVATVGLGALSALANAPDGKLAVAGIFNNGSDASPSVARIDADGTVGPTFTAPVTLGSAPAGSSLSNFTALAVRPDGTTLALVGGYGVESDTTLQVDRFLPSGGFDPTFGANGVLAVTVAPTPLAGENVATEALQPNAAALTAGGRLVGAGTITVTTRPSSSVFLFAGTQGALARLSVTTASVPGDYDGDGKSDLAAELTTFDTFAYCPSGGTADVLANFGAGGLGQTIPAPGDYDGDGRTDVAAYLSADGVLVYRPSAGGADVVVPFGLPGIGQTVPAAANFAAFAGVTAAGTVAASDGAGDALALTDNLAGPEVTPPRPGSKRHRVPA